MDTNDGGPAFPIPRAELLPCPFCGSGDIRIYLNAPSSDTRPWNHVTCLSCGTGHSSVARWNSRADSAEITARRARDAEVEALVAALREAMEWNWLDVDARPSTIADQCDKALLPFTGAKP